MSVRLFDCRTYLAVLIAMKCLRLHWIAINRTESLPANIKKHSLSIGEDEWYARENADLLPAALVGSCALIPTTDPTIAVDPLIIRSSESHPFHSGAELTANQSEIVRCLYRSTIQFLHCSIISLQLSASDNTPDD
jgi:hypothetical protein